MLKKAVLGIMALMCAGAFFWILWRGGAFLPRWIAWENGVFCDASGEYEIGLAHRKAQVRRDGKAVWTSPKEWRIQQALSGDIDRDGRDELVFLCWRIGRYGRSRPFWVERDERKWSQHIAVYEYDGDGMKRKWVSSYIGSDVAKMAVSGHNSLLLTDRGQKVSGWFWDSWGFTREETEVSFAVFGDNLIHQPIYQYGLYRDETFGFLFENVREAVAESDVAVINQETPFVDDPALYSGYPRFGTPVQVGEAIAAAGFDVASCATNHALDQGVYGVGMTKTFLESHGVMCLGIQSENEKEYEPYDIVVRNGVRIAMLNYTYGVNGSGMPDKIFPMVHLLDSEEQIGEDLAKARSDADVVIVFVHWGTEYEEQPDESQQRWAQVFLEGEADVVVGTHPHALQPCEILRDEDGHETLVYYSIGNYISAQPEKSCVKGGMAAFTLSLTPDGYKVTSYALRPLAITWQEEGKCTVDFLDRAAD